MLRIQFSPGSLLLLLLLLFLISGCSFIRPAPQYDRRGDTSPPTTGTPDTGQTAVTDGQREQLLRAFIGRWQGVPYRYGGNDFSGVDCSGLVCTTMLELFCVDLPLTTSEQIHSGRAVPTQSDLRSGDLIFFRIRGERHVALFLGQGEIGHATVSQGVTISRLGASYWSDSFIGARRVLE